VPLFPTGAVRPLRLVMLSGDWIPVSLPDRVRSAFPGARVISLGGATEATVWSNWYPVLDVDPRWPSIPYGRPIANARYLVLDESLLPCPIGVPGDLYIGGACLCTGYTGQPELTASAFGPDPFSAEPGARLYRTGDRARFFPDGNLEFLGRVDQQVKIRGYRIELGEVEAVLESHSGVRACVVLARRDLPGSGGEPGLVAYVVGDATADTLRQSLRERLPAYMVPAVFVRLEALPVTSNGKVDRQALPVPQPFAGIYEAPDTEVQNTIAEIWQAVLRLERIGLHDSFFELGGTSLSLVEVRSRLREALGCEVSLVDLFRSPTVASLALLLAPPPEERPERPAPSFDSARQRARRRRLAVQQRHPGSLGDHEIEEEVR
jgi:acyl carrier protein